MRTLAFRVLVISLFVAMFAGYFKIKMLIEVSVVLMIVSFLVWKVLDFFK